jgi:chaperonin cofactor prefoldin
MANGEPDINTQALIELAMVKGQLTTVIQLLQHNHVDTHRRIDDLKAAVDQRFDDLAKTVDSRFDMLDDRVNTVEANERSTALRTAAYGGGAAALVTAAIEAIKHIRP